MQPRRHRRFLTSCPILLVQSGGDSYPGKLTNLSLKGCRVTSHLAAVTSMQLRLNVELGETYPVTVNKATVRWSSVADMGLEFLEMESAELARLANVINRLQADANPIVKLQHRNSNTTVGDT